MRFISVPFPSTMTFLVEISRPINNGKTSHTPSTGHSTSDREMPVKCRSQFILDNYLTTCINEERQYLLSSSLFIISCISSSNDHMA